MRGFALRRRLHAAGLAFRGWELPRHERPATAGNGAGRGLAAGWDVSGCWRAARGERWGWSSSASMPRFCWRARSRCTRWAGRPDIFAFPVSCSWPVAPTWLPQLSPRCGCSAAALVVTVVLVWPPRADYVGNVMNDLLLVEVLAAHERPAMAHDVAGGLLPRFYGQWPFEIAAYDEAPNGTRSVGPILCICRPPFSKSGPEKRPRANSCGDIQWSPRVVRGLSAAWPGVMEALECSGSTKCARPAKERVAVRRDGTRSLLAGCGESRG